MTAGTTREPTTEITGRLPRGFLAWVGAASVSTVGSAALSFAVGWYATGEGPGFAGLVVLATVVPRAVLLLFGGVLADRCGPRRAMVLGDAVMVAVTLVVALTAALDGIHGWLLLGVAVVGGVVDAVYLPASGALPRLFVGDERLARAVALRSSASQVAFLAGPAVGGALVALGGLSGVATADALTFVVALVVLVVVRPPREVARSTAPSRLWAEIGATLGEAWRDRFLRAALLAMGILAAAVLPIFGLGIPLLVRHHGWGSSAAAVTEAGWFVGGLVVAAVIARTGTCRRPGLVGAAAPLVAAAGAATLGLASSVPAAVCGALVLAVGVSLCTGHIAPLFLRRVPAEAMARYQSLFVLVQMAPLVVSNAAYAWVASCFGAPAVFAVMTVLLLGVAAALGLSRPVREAR